MAELAAHLLGWAFLGIVVLGAVLFGKDDDPDFFLASDTAHPSGAEPPRGAEDNDYRRQQVTLPEHAFERVTLPAPPIPGAASQPVAKGAGPCAGRGLDREPGGKPAEVLRPLTTRTGAREHTLAPSGRLAVAERLVLRSFQRLSGEHRSVAVDLLSALERMTPADARRLAELARRFTR